MGKDQLFVNNTAVTFEIEIKNNIRFGNSESFVLYFYNLIVLVTQNLIGSFDFSEVLYIVYNNLP